ncbi:enoyl-CoA hydratase-related protein [Mycolicibacterium septicum]|uniref:enoyl-CoA hydratase-related protein n=1 Tax=Mycolicibacterium septicum TaxID=98668 RepID=UPI0023E24507|nr:enoyl-CoA hydratase-related protein [Mycolicibacterium septicum]MDF3342207.1 enoyl-CoA hydratase-related protein [Mycolicibacterium septicum]
MEYTTITYSAADQIATITLNRPEARNGFTLTMADELNAALRAADRDDLVRVVILRAVGKHFCVGMDMAGGDPTVGDPDDPNWDEPATRVARPMANLNKPVIAAIQGAAVGVGLSMTLAADFRLASEDARFGFVFARRGLFPEGGSLWFLPQIVGLAKAKEWMITGRIFDVDEAADTGLVTGVYPREELWTAADALARDIASNVAPVSVAVIRRGLTVMAARGNPEAAFAIDRQTISYGFTSPDMAEGVASFLQKRQPAFTGVAREEVSRFPWLAFERE